MKKSNKNLYIGVLIVILMSFNTMLSGEVAPPSRLEVDECGYATWSEPVSGIELSNHNGYNSGFGNNGEIYLACLSMFDSSQLSDYYGSYELTQINFTLNSLDFSQLRIQVCEGGTSNMPGTCIYNQDIASAPIVAGESFTHTLSSPITLTGDNRYWIGYEIMTTGGMPIGVDSGPMVEGHGGWFSMGGLWNQINQLNPNFNYNWVISGTVVPTSRAINRDLIGYNVYLDGSCVGNTTDLFYDYDDGGLVDDQSYLAEVTAVYDEGESEPVECTFTYDPPYFAPPSGLEVDECGYATWSEPVSGIELSNHNGYNSGFGNNGEIYLACLSMFDSSQLSDYYGSYELTQINFTLNSLDFSQLRIQVCEGGTSNMPGTCIYNQDIASAPIVAGESFTHTLSSPITLTGDNRYWIGYEIMTTGGMPIGVDSGPMVEGHGGWFSMGGLWNQINQLNPNFNYNWVISGTVVPTSRAINRDLIGYNVYLDGSCVGNTTDLFYDYDDGGLVDDQSYLAEVTAVYDEGESEPVECTFTYIVEIPDAPENVVISVSEGFVTITWNPIADATSYVVYSCETPYDTFTVDTSGTFSGESWTAPAANTARYFYVKSIQ